METPQQLPELAKMRAGVDYRFQIRLREFLIWARPLTIGEHMRINEEVIEELTKAPVSQRNAINENYLLAKKILAKTCTNDPNDPKMGQLNDYVLDQMTVDETMFLYDQWLKGVERVDPRLEEMKIEDLQGLVEQIKKNEITLTELSSWQVTNLARYLLDQTQLQTDS